jgi:hypothetical protein
LPSETHAGGSNAILPRNQVFGGDGFGVGWSQADDLVSLGSIYYSFIIRNVRNPPNTQSKWLVGWTGIAEFFYLRVSTYGRGNWEIRF